MTRKFWKSCNPSLEKFPRRNLLVNYILLMRIYWNSWIWRKGMWISSTRREPVLNHLRKICTHASHVPEFRKFNQDYRVYRLRGKKTGACSNYGENYSCSKPPFEGEAKNNSTSSSKGLKCDVNGSAELTLKLLFMLFIHDRTVGARPVNGYTR